MSFRSPVDNIDFGVHYTIGPTSGIGGFIFGGGPAFSAGNTGT